MLLQPKILSRSKKSKPIAPPSSDDGYRAIFERHPYPAWILDRATLHILAVSDAAVAQFGYSRQEFVGMSYLEIQAPEQAMEVKEKLGQLTASRGSARWMQKTKEGVPVSVQPVWRPVPFNRVPAILLTVNIPTPRRMRRLLQETEEGRMRLEALSRRLVEIQESERSKIARLIHDEIGQLLTGLKLMLVTGGESERSGGAPRSAPTRREEMVGIVNELIGRLRDFSMDLRPPMLDEIGLVAALHWHFERYTARTNVHVSFRHDRAEVRFPAAVEIAAFRIIQEAITNVARHARVDAVEVELTADPKYLELRIEDSGIGYGPTTTAGRSAGLTGMQERALLLGGHFSIESALGVGTRVLAELPLRSSSETWE
ncbi:MAG TPA: ATP-binding protein [Candidatus Eisenbacteria bacterium]